MNGQPPEPLKLWLWQVLNDALAAVIVAIALWSLLQWMM